MQNIVTHAVMLNKFGSSSMCTCVCVREREREKKKKKKKNKKNGGETKDLRGN